MNVIKEIIHNYLMSYSLVSSWAKKYHTTGMNENKEAINASINFYTEHTSLENKSILEIGPGQTLGVLKRAFELGAKSCSAVDVSQYFTKDYAISQNVDYRIYDGEKMPFEDQSFDVVWSFDVFEHVREAGLVMQEISRVLKPEGKLISRIDLRDHFYLDDKLSWLNCFKYSDSLWRKMTYNRSNFINRLRKSEWEKIAKSVFKDVSVKPFYEESLIAIRDKIPNLKAYSEEDVKTWQIDLICSN